MIFWVGLIILSVSFLLMAYGLIAFKNVFERMREVKETMISRTDLNEI